jgi:hypothetical protein
MNANQVNLKEDNTSKTGGDLDETFIQEITQKLSQEKINTKQVDYDLEEGNDSSEKIDGPIPPWIR